MRKTEVDFPKVGKVHLIKRSKGYKSLPVDKRYNVANEIGKKQPVWAVKRVSDIDMSYYMLVAFRNYEPSPFGDADKDGVMNIFDVAPLNPKIKKQVPPTMKEGNYKLDKVIGVFSLPRWWTCPGKTPLCSKYCYAEQPERFRQGVVHSRNKNEAWTWRPDFADVMGRMIKSMAFPYFRIHESGDFYNQDYLNKWIEIANKNPNTKFLAYTKNYHLDFTKIPENLTIRYSTDLSSEHFRDDLCQCFVGLEKPTTFFTCKKKCQPGFCMACWDKTIDVFIPLHSVGKKQVDVMFNKQFNTALPKKYKQRMNRRADYRGYEWGGELTPVERKRVAEEMSAMKKKEEDNILKKAKKVNAKVI